MRKYRPTGKTHSLGNVHKITELVLAGGELVQAYEAHTGYAQASVNKQDLGRAEELGATHALLKTGSGVFLCTIEELREELSNLRLNTHADRPSRNYWAIKCREEWKAELDRRVVQAGAAQEPEYERVTYRPSDPSRPLDEVIGDKLLPADFYNPTASRILGRRPNDLLSVRFNLWDGTVTVVRRKR